MRRPRQVQETMAKRSRGILHAASAGGSLAWVIITFHKPC